MKNRIQIAILTLILYSTSAFAAGGTEEGGGISLMVKLFFAFLAAVFVFQLIPALVLFGSMVVAIFKREPKKAETVENEQISESS